MEDGTVIDGAALINTKLAELGPEFSLAMEIPRVWATGAQAFINPDFSVVLFREQNIIAPPTGGVEPVVSIKNVASIVMPTKVLLEFHQSLVVALATLAEGAQKDESAHGSAAE